MTATNQLLDSISAYADGRYLDAFELCERALQTATSGESLDVSIYAINLWLAEVCLQLADFRKARRYVENSNKCSSKEIDSELHSKFASVADIDSVEWRLLSALGEHDDAQAGIVTLVERQKEKFGVDSLHFANALNSQGRILCDSGQPDDAAAPLRRAMSMRERLIGVDSVSFAESLHNLSLNYSMQNNYTLSEALGNRALTLRRKHLRASHPLIGYSLDNLGTQKLKHQDAKKAQENFTAALKILENELPPKHTHLSLTLSGLGTALVAQRKYKEAKELLDRALLIAEEANGNKDLLLMSALTSLSLAHLGLFQFKEAEPYTKRALHMVEHSEQLKVASEKGLLDRLMVCYVLQFKIGDAVRLYPDTMRANHTASFAGFVDTIASIGEFAKKQLPPRENI